MTDADLVWRDYATDGDPTSGAHKPVKSDIRALFTAIDDRQAGLITYYGAVGDGITDDSIAFAAALASGVPLNGAGLTYAISGNFTLPDSCYIENATFKQLEPNTVPCRTLNRDGGSGPLTLRNVKIDRNGTGFDGQIGDAASIHLANFDNILLDEVEVYGNGYGLAIFMTYCNNIRIVRPYIHDMHWALTVPPTGELMGGIGLISCTKGAIVDPRVIELWGNVQPDVGPPGPMIVDGASDGITIGNCTDVSTYGGIISRCGDGTDVTGSGTNRRIKFFGTHYHECGYGQKWVHEAIDCVSEGCSSERCGLAGLLIGGTNSANHPNGGPRDIRVKGFQAIDTGIAVDAALYAIAGIAINSGEGGIYAPQNILLTDCVAVDRQVATCTITIASPGVVATVEDHNKVVGDRVYFLATHGLLGGLALNTMYYVQSTPTTKTYTVAATNGGAAIATTATAWATATGYVVGDHRSNGGLYYECIVAHTSGVFATDLAAGKWAQSIFSCSMPTMEYGLRNEAGAALNCRSSNFHTFGAKIDDHQNTVAGVWNQPDVPPANNAFLVATGSIGSVPTWTRNVHASKLFSTGRGVMTLANGLNSNIAMPDNTSLVSIAGVTGAFSIGGIVPTQTDGQHLWIDNNTAFDMTIVNNDASSLGTNRIVTKTGANLTLTADSDVHLIYNGAFGNWRVFGQSG